MDGTLPRRGAAPARTGKRGVWLAPREGPRPCPCNAGGVTGSGDRGLTPAVPGNGGSGGAAAVLLLPLC